MRDDSLGDIICYDIWHNRFAIHIVLLNGCVYLQTNEKNAIKLCDFDFAPHLVIIVAVVVTRSPASLVGECVCRCVFPLLAFLFLFLRLFVYVCFLLCDMHELVHISLLFLFAFRCLNALIVRSTVFYGELLCNGKVRAWSMASLVMRLAESGLYGNTKKQQQHRQP